MRSNTLGPEIAVSIGFRDSGDPDRLRNLQTCLAALGRQTLGRERYRILLVEQDCGPKLEPLPGIDRYVFDGRDGEYNRARALNRGATVMREAWGCGSLCFLDADLVVPEDWLERCLEAMRDAYIVLPFDKIWYLTAGASRKVCEQVPPCETWRGLPAGKVGQSSVGGAMTIRSDLYRTLGGHDERFEGWGCEDTDFWFRARKQVPIRRLPGVTLLHLHHAKADRQSPGAKHNQELFAEIYGGRRAHPVAYG
jgi:GT2 family glycosyltransferase